MSTEPKLSHSEAAESLFSLHLFWSLKENDVRASAIRKFSLENNLFQTVSQSIAARLDVPFVICMAGRGKAYFADKDETSSVLRKILNKEDKISEVDVTEAWNTTSGDMTDPLLNEEPPKTAGRSNADRQITKFLSYVSTITEDHDYLLKNLIKKSWKIHNEMLGEVLTSIDIHDHITTVDGYLILENLPEALTSQYRRKFISLAQEIPYTNGDELISKIESEAEKYDLEEMQSTIDEVIDFLKNKVAATRRFQDRLNDQEPTSTIRVCDTSETGFLNYPFPPQ